MRARVTYKGAWRTGGGQDPNIPSSLTNKSEWEKNPQRNPPPWKQPQWGGGLSLCPRGQRPLPPGHGHRNGEGPSQTSSGPPPQGANATVSPGLSQLPSAPGRPPDHSPTSLRLGREGAGGAPPTPPSHFSPTFARFPTSIGSVRKLIVYKYPSSARPGTQVEAAGGHQGPPQPWRPAGAGRGLFPAGKGP